VFFGVVAALSLQAYADGQLIVWRQVKPVSSSKARGQTSPVYEA